MDSKDSGQAGKAETSLSILQIKNFREKRYL